MGSSSSKAARAAEGAARKYPTRTSPTFQPPASSATRAGGRPMPAGPVTHPRPQAASSRSEAINLDASDPDFARSLRAIGPVIANPTLSNTSTFSGQGDGVVSQTQAASNIRLNPAIAVLDARARLQDAADKEFIEAGRRGHPGRQFLDVYTIRQMLVLRDDKRQTAQQIEKALGLRQGTVERLGPRGVLSLP